jgi:hypothetical protein
VKKTTIAILAGLCGGIAWMLGVIAFFGPAQAVLTNPAYQSAKFLSVMTEIEPLPRVGAKPGALVLGVLLIGIVYGIVYARIRESLGSGSLSRGLRFGFVAWALMALWFEFYLPWNVMHEPSGLVVLELVLWLLLLLLVGVTIASVYEPLARRTAT